MRQHNCHIWAWKRFLFGTLTQPPLSGASFGLNAKLVIYILLIYRNKRWKKPAETNEMSLNVLFFNASTGDCSLSITQQQKQRWFEGQNGRKQFHKYGGQKSVKQILRFQHLFPPTPTPFLRRSSNAHTQTSSSFRSVQPLLRFSIRQHCSVCDGFTTSSSLYALFTCVCA